MLEVMVDLVDRGGAQACSIVDEFTILFVAAVVGDPTAVGAEVIFSTIPLPVSDR